MHNDFIRLLKFYIDTLHQRIGSSNKTNPEKWLLHAYKAFTGDKAEVEVKL